MPQQKCEGAAAGILILEGPVVVVSVIRLAVMRSKDPFDAITLGGLCCFVPVAAFAGCVAGAADAVSKSPVQGALAGCVVMGAPFAALILWCLMVAEPNSLRFAFQLLPATEIAMLAGGFAGGMGSIAGKRNMRKRAQRS